MRIAVMGSGGVGGYFGGRLAASGQDVVFVARGEHLAAMRKRGLRVRSSFGDFVVDPVKCTDDPSTLGPIDIVLFTVKMWDTDAAARAVAPLVADDTAVVSLQNGVEAEGRLAALLGPERVMGGVAQVTASIAQPGMIVQSSTSARLIFGELDGRRSARAERFWVVCQQAGIDAVLSSEIQKELWTKLAYICGFAGSCAVTRQPLGAVLADPDCRQIFIDCMSEAGDVARALGVDLDSDLVERHLALAEGFGAEVKPSMLVDLERGNRLEVEWLNGTVARLGRQLGIPTPTNQFVWTALKPHAGGHQPA